MAGASNSVGVWCTDCESWVTKALNFAPSPWLPKDHRLLVGVNRVDLPRVNVVKVACEICERETMTPELHHWCPRALYRENAPPNEGPQAWLCRPCHKTWHEIVTPGLLPMNALAYVRTTYKRLRKIPGAWADFVRVVNDADAAVRLMPPTPRRDAA